MVLFPCGTTVRHRSVPGDSSGAATTRRRGASLSVSRYTTPFTMPMGLYAASWPVNSGRMGAAMSGRFGLPRSATKSSFFVLVPLFVVTMR